MNATRWERRAVCVVACWWLLALGVSAQEGMHKISFTFDYDFGSTPACSKKIKKGCVEQFNFYDISEGIGKKIKLGSMPVPREAKGLMKGITATTESLMFNSGKHMIAVAAQLADGSESDLRKCRTIVTIP